MAGPERASVPPAAPRSPAADDLFADFTPRTFGPPHGALTHGQLGEIHTPRDGVEWIAPHDAELLDDPGYDHEVFDDDLLDATSLEAGAPDAGLGAHSLDDAALDAVLHELESENGIALRHAAYARHDTRDGDDEDEDDADDEPAREGTDRIVLLTHRKSQPPPDHADAESDDDADRAQGEITVRKTEAEILATAGPKALRPEPLPDIRSFGPFGPRSERSSPALDVAPRSAGSGPSSLSREAEEPWQSVVPQRSENTQRVEAARLVPDVASVPPPAHGPQEGSEDGQMPSGELDRKLADMDVLLRYGHAAQVASELEALRLVYPGDLLLVRRIAELYIARDMRGPALEMLFTLAHGLFERRNVEGMKQALEQVRVLDPENRRAKRLLGLLSHRRA